MNVFKYGLVGVAVAFLLLSAWRWRDSGWLAPLIGRNAPAPRAIVFDNGTVRAQPASEAASGQVVALPVPGGMRKCVRRGEVVYTDRTCPPGMKEADIDTSRFNQVPGR
jgi:hypothetical protein